MKIVKHFRSNLAILCAVLYLMGGVTVCPLAADGQVSFIGLRQNVGEAVNNSYDQIAPFFSPSGSQLFFAQNSHAGGYYEVWETTLDVAGNLLPAKRLAGLQSSALYNQTVFGVLPDNWLLINGQFPLQNGQRAYQKGFSWYPAIASSFDPALAKPITIQGLDTKLTGAFANVFFHPKRKVLFLSIANPDKRDIFIAFPEDTIQWPITQWKKPIPLQDINSPFEDSCPFLDERGKVLYFSSNRPGGYGSDDIYASFALSDDLLQWSPPVNLGFGVNSNFSELYFSTYSHQPYAYFVSYKHSMGAGDIFRIQKQDTLFEPPLITREQEDPVITTPAQPQIAAPASPSSTIRTVAPGQLAEEKYAPNNITFLLDKSVSMAQRARMDILRKSCFLLLQKLRYLDKVSLITFGEKTNLIYGTQSLQSPDSLLQLIQRLAPDEGETFINDGLHKAIAQAADFFIPNGNNEIFVITDGYFSISSRTIDLLSRHPQLVVTFVLVDAGNIEANIKRYVKQQLPEAIVLTLSTQKEDEVLLLEHIKSQSEKARYP